MVGRFFTALHSKVNVKFASEKLIIRVIIFQVTRITGAMQQR